MSRLEDTARPSATTTTSTPTSASASASASNTGPASDSHHHASSLVSDRLAASPVAIVTIGEVCDHRAPPASDATDNGASSETSIHPSAAAPSSSTSANCDLGTTSSLYHELPRDEEAAGFYEPFLFPHYHLEATGERTAYPADFTDRRGAPASDATDEGVHGTVTAPSSTSYDLYLHSGAIIDNGAPHGTPASDLLRHDVAYMAGAPSTTEAAYPGSFYTPVVYPYVAPMSGYEPYAAPHYGVYPQSYHRAPIDASSYIFGHRAASSSAIATIGDSYELSIDHGTAAASSSTSIGTTPFHHELNIDTEAAYSGSFYVAPMSGYEPYAAPYYGAAGSHTLHHDSRGSGPSNLHVFASLGEKLGDHLKPSPEAELLRPWGPAVDIPVAVPGGGDYLERAARLFLPAAPPPPPPTSAKYGDPKTELCLHWNRSRSCKIGDQCKFAHGGEELVHVPLPKYRRACRYGQRCPFQHSSVKRCFYKH
jgi:hypothetical protein